MGAAAPTPPPHDEQLATALAALASPTRLQLLRALRTPRALAEIHVRAPGDERILARQTVREHLNKLLQAGMVTAREVDRAYGDTMEFVANHQTIFALAEEMRSLSRVRPAVMPDAVTAHAAPPAPPAATGPRLVMVKGLDEGTTWPLRPPAARAPLRPEWLIGRRRGIAVSLDFDPYVSGENSRIVLEGGAHVVEDVGESRNGTSVNFRRLARGERHALRHGDLVGVGRCLLVYWT